LKYLFHPGKGKGKDASLGSVPIGVEVVSNLLFQGPALRGWWSYIRPSNDLVYSSQL